MTRRLDEVTRTFESTQADISNGRLRYRLDIETKSFERTIMFARMNAKAMLISNSTELNRRYASICPSNAVRQILLKSKSSDCTLQEFQLVASKLQGNPAIACSIHPSEFYVQFPSSAQAARFEIFFDSFADFCAALRICVHDREAGVLRTKKTRGTRAKNVQVLGVEVLNNLETGTKERRVVLAQSIRTFAARAKIPVLLQRSTAWSDGSCKYGFSLSPESSSELNAHVQTAVQSHNATDARSTDLDKIPAERRFFALTWERSSGPISKSVTIYPEHVPGVLRSFLPAVVLRGNVLTSSTEDIFRTRLNGMLLKQVLVSPARTITPENSTMQPITQPMAS